MKFYNADITDNTENSVTESIVCLLETETEMEDYRTGKISTLFKNTEYSDKDICYYLFPTDCQPTVAENGSITSDNSEYAYEFDTDNLTIRLTSIVI